MNWSTAERELWERLRDGETVVVSMRQSNGYSRLSTWAKERGLFVRVDRTSKWGNPYLIGRDGDRDAVIRRYEHEFLPNRPALLDSLGELRRSVLGCWCAPLRCHGDVLATATRGLADPPAS